MKSKIFILLTITFSILHGQGYVWPTNTGKQLTSNFGEFRNKHFHMGLDIRTRGSVGHPIYAISDGYIHRIATNFKGYGKAIYLKTSDDKIALYGHLDRFSNKLEAWLFETQIQNQSYFVDNYFAQDEFPIKHGEIIGYSGNSGSSMGPHLHFELRNDKDQPLNPMTFSFPVADNIPPKFLDLSIVPLSSGTHIDGSPLPKNYTPLRTSSNTYTLKDTLLINGIFGIATRVIDKIQNVTHSYQIEKLDLFVDSISTFSIQYDLLDFREGENISTVYGQPINHPKHNEFQKLYWLKSYPKLTIHKNDKTGTINLKDGLRKIEILAQDAAQNESTLTFYLKSEALDQKPQYNISLNLNDYTILNTKSKVFNPELFQLESGAIFQLHTNITYPDNIVAFIEKPDIVITFPLTKIGADKYISEMIDPYLFNGINSCGFLFHSNIVQKFEFNFTPTLVLPNTTTTIFSKDSLCIATTNNSIYDTTLMWITKQVSPSSHNIKNHKTNVYKLHPDGIPFKNDIMVSVDFDKEADLEHCSFYAFNKKKFKWDLENSSLDTLNNMITAKISEANIFTVLEDTKPPWFNYTYPKNQQTYLKNTVKNLKIIIDDDISGINSSEEYLKVYLDGNRIWIAYQPIKKEISYVLKNPLLEGKHNLLINIQDRSGNSASKTINFLVE